MVTTARTNLQTLTLGQNWKTCLFFVSLTLTPVCWSLKGQICLVSYISLTCCCTDCRQVDWQLNRTGTLKLKYNRPRHLICTRALLYFFNVSIIFRLEKKRLLVSGKVNLLCLYCKCLKSREVSQNTELVSSATSTTLNGDMHAFWRLHLMKANLFHSISVLYGYFPHKQEVIWKTTVLHESSDQ